MRSSYILLFTLLLPLCLQSQENSLDAKIQQDIAKDGEKLQKDLQKDYEKGRINHEVYVELEVDIFKIDEFIVRKLENDPSSLNYVTLLIEAEYNYQELLEKYYKRLLDLIYDADKHKLEESQQAWKMWHYQEKNLNKAINDSKYMPSAEDLEISAEHFLNLTKERVIDLADYIARIRNETTEGSNN